MNNGLKQKNNGKQQDKAMQNSNSAKQLIFCYLMYFCG